MKYVEDIYRQTTNAGGVTGGGGHESGAAAAFGKNIFIGARGAGASASR